MISQDHLHPLAVALLLLAAAPLRRPPHLHQAMMRRRTLDGRGMLSARYIALKQIASVRDWMQTQAKQLSDYACLLVCCNIAY